MIKIKPGIPVMLQILAWNSVLQWQTFYSVGRALFERSARLVHRSSFHLVVASRKLDGLDPGHCQYWRLVPRQIEFANRCSPLKLKVIRDFYQKVFRLRGMTFLPVWACKFCGADVAGWRFCLGCWYSGRGGECRSKNCSTLLWKYFLTVGILLRRSIIVGSVKSSSIASLTGHGMSEFD